MSNIQHKPSLSMFSVDLNLDAPPPGRDWPTPRPLRLDPALIRRNASGVFVAPGTQRTIPEALLLLLAFDGNAREFCWHGSCPYCRAQLFVIGWPASGGIVGYRTRPCCKEAKRDGFVVIVEPDAWRSVKKTFFAKHRPARGPLA